MVCDEVLEVQNYVKTGCTIALGSYLRPNHHWSCTLEIGGCAFVIRLEGFHNGIFIKSSFMLSMLQMYDLDALFKPHHPLF